jgi:ATP-dependent NAD(P)H-hydrate dehydratase
MVHPYMRSSKQISSKDASALDAAAQEVIDMLPRLHVIVIGPGLGRDPVMQEIVARVITEAKKKNLPFVLDADGLYIAQMRPELIDGYKECIMTPNVVEFGRLAKSKGIDTTKEDPATMCATLAKAFGGPTIIQKGGKDYISNGKTTLISDGEGGLKRSGGQGDTLTGSLGTFLAWRQAYLDKIWDHDGDDLDRDELLTLAAYAGSAITRECSRLAFKLKGRSLQAGDLTDCVHEAFLNVIGENTKGAEGSRL